MRKKTSNKKKKPMPKNLKKFLIGLLAVCFTCALVGVFVGSYVLKDVITTVNGDRLIDLAFYQENQDQTTIIYAYDEENKPVELVRLHGEENRVWVEKENMSEWIGKAFIAIEDKRFYDHGGVDWYGTVLGVAKSGFKRGASTITQQLIKNLTGENGRTVNRKYNEILTAMNLEKHYDKDTILEAYLNTIYLSHGCYGVKTAAETYFGKDISELNIAECAAIAGITQYPGKYDPLWNPEANKDRQEYCLKNMLEQDMITKEQYDEAMAYELIFTNSEKYVEKDNDDDIKDSAVNNEIQSYYVDYVIDSVISDLKEQGYSHYEATKMIYSGGLRIYSAVDLQAQEILEDVYVHRTNFPSERVTDPNNPAQSAMTVMDYSGRIVALVGGAGEKTQNRANNRAVSAIRQPGSSIKPISIYAPAMEEGYITWSTKVKNYGIQWKGKTWPTNYGGDPGSPSSYVTAQYAIAISYNTVPAQLLMQMGFNTSYKYLTDNFHISTLNSSIDSQSPSALATGGTAAGVTTLEMAAAFAPFGNGGKYYEPYCYYKVTNSTGEEIILQNNSESEQVISAETAYIMNQMMRTVITSGTAKGYGVKGFTTFAKSGTTTNNNDRWMVAGTPYYVAAVWFGHDYNKEIHASGNPAGTIYKTVMDRLHSKLATKDFEKYTDKVVQRSYCTSSGLLAGENCSSTAMGWYDTTKLPGTCAGCGNTPPAENETTTAPPSSEGEQTTTPPQTEESSTAPPPEESTGSSSSGGQDTGGA